MEPKIYCARFSTSNPPLELGYGEGKKEVMWGGYKMTRHYYVTQIRAFSAEDAIAQLKVRHEPPLNDKGGYRFQFGKHLPDFQIDDIWPFA